MSSAFRRHLFGELAAVLADGEVFEAFVRDEGCHSSLARPVGRGMGRRGWGWEEGAGGRRRGGW